MQKTAPISTQFNEILKVSTKGVNGKSNNFSFDFLKNEIKWNKNKIILNIFTLIVA